MDQSRGGRAASNSERRGGKQQRGTFAFSIASFLRAIASRFVCSAIRSRISFCGISFTGLQSPVQSCNQTHEGAGGLGCAHRLLPGFVHAACCCLRSSRGNTLSAT